MVILTPVSLVLYDAVQKLGVFEIVRGLEFDGTIRESLSG